jgi:hypothetical protein
MRRQVIPRNPLAPGGVVVGGNQAMVARRRGTDPVVVVLWQIADRIVLGQFPR